MTSAGLRHGFEHHVWATLRLIDACSSLSAEQLAHPVPGIYGGVLDTMRHIVGADASYLFRVTDGRVPSIDEETMDLIELRAVMERHSVAWASVLDAGPDPDADVLARRDDGTVRHAPVGIRLVQALHHGTDHRSQICTALTTFGVEPPEIDVWGYGVVAGLVHDAPPVG
jgi:uncharacterized damage-inducible protein DinB